jgi:hypothetical protein
MRDASQWPEDWQKAWRPRSREPVDSIESPVYQRFRLSITASVGVTSFSLPREPALKEWLQTCILLAKFSGGRMSVSERRELSDRRVNDRRRAESDDLYTRLKEKRNEIETERRHTLRRQTDRRISDRPDPPNPPISNTDQAQRWAENLENPAPGSTRKPS